ncbi:virus tail fibre assembly protein, lambda gpK [Kosakonia arachidis]|uniref:Virus tail fibre assembly protein, lambda gpK n=1 Tax=Kosakonia arachidis TaxID=551989 RepID=A0A1I6XZE4_9ENTR|nr:tail fiber assembly protein [Kosakonia arachidis]SFT43755.1 virus tail fibre assembly protein, lambda gpK [Kosakonia arachidis]
MYAYSNGVFYPLSMQADYESAGTWPTSYVEVNEDVFHEFISNQPEGKQRGTDSSGMPAWIDIPATPNSELLKAALISLSAEYQGDMESLNRAWLAAAVNDGTSEGTKKNAVIAQISARKAQYASDRDEIIAQYPI